MIRRYTRPRHGQEPRGIQRFTAEYLRSAEGRAFEARFGRMFKQLVPFEPDDVLLAQLAADMVEPDDLDDDSVFDSNVPSGYTVLGQFVTHDLTYDTTTLDDQADDPDAIVSFRSPRLDLDSVYAKSPSSTENPPRDPNDSAKMLIATSTDPHTPVDLPRLSDGTARIGDPRNDENLLICQLHLAFLQLHNRFVDDVRTTGMTDEEVFEEARRQARWHFQWVIVHDYLPRIVGPDTVDAILGSDGAGRPTVNLKFYQPTNPQQPMMPLEFAVAAFRFGHSVVRAVYQVNDDNPAVIFGQHPTEENLNGHRPIPEDLVVDWRHFFELPGAADPPDNMARKIDSHLSPPLTNLPVDVLPEGESPPETVLAVRDLERGKRRGLPSGQAVACAIRDVLGNAVEVLNNRTLGLSGAGWQGQAPLWFYILKEAELREHGQQLGTVGGRIVAEVVLGVLDFDPTSYFHATPVFQPKPSVANASGQLNMGDLLHFAGIA